MGRFKNWLAMQEMAIGTSGVDSQPTQTAQITQQIAQKWMSDQHNADAQARMNAIGMQHKSALGKNLLDAGTNAVKMAGNNLGRQTTAPQVAGAIQNNLGLPTVIKPPKPTQVKMMRKRMRRI
jgi:hypothetical protein